MTTPATIHFEKWPSLLMIARHGYSVANERKDLAKQNGQEPAWVGITRDQDAELTQIGHQQAFDLGVMIGQSEDENLPEVIITSPYLRAKQTTAGIVKGIQKVRPGYNPRVVIEERIREIEFGVMDGIDRKKFRELYPLEADRRERDGKYYYRPPGGENRPDVRIRVHQVLDTLNRDYVGMKVLIVCHSVVVLAFRSLIERWEEDEYLKVDKEDDCKNCGLTVYRRFENRKLVLHGYNITANPVVSVCRCHGLPECPDLDTVNDYEVRGMRDRDIGIGPHK
jgi:2,3-bisphosphoglycerate-dependent phosphoglycerate mutase